MIIDRLTGRFAKNVGSNNYRLAKLIQDEIDELKTAFGQILQASDPATAIGVNLTRTAHNYGITRTTGENDDHLRHRLLVRIYTRRIGSNPPDIVQAIRNVESIEAATLTEFFDPDRIEFLDSTRKLDSSWKLDGTGTFEAASFAVRYSQSATPPIAPQEILDIVKGAGIKAEATLEAV